MKRISKEPLVHQFIVNYWTTRGYSPSYREIANGTELRSLNAVKIHINALIQKGFLAREKGMARTIRPVQSTEVLT